MRSLPFYRPVEIAAGAAFEKGACIAFKILKILKILGFFGRRLYPLPRLRLRAFSKSAFVAKYDTVRRQI